MGHRQTELYLDEDGLDPAKSDFGKVADYDKLIDEIRMESK